MKKTLIRVLFLQIIRQYLFARLKDQYFAWKFKRRAKKLRKNFKRMKRSRIDNLKEYKFATKVLFEQKEI